MSRDAPGKVVELVELVEAKIDTASRRAGQWTGKHAQRRPHSSAIEKSGPVQGGVVGAREGSVF